MSSLVACIQATPCTSLSSTSASTSTNTNTTVTVQAGTGTGTYTYLWSTTGTACTITNGTTVTPTFTVSAPGSSIATCSITDTVRKITVNSPEFIITWVPIPITSVTFRLYDTTGSFNVNPFNADRNVVSSNTFAIQVVSVSPVGATYSPSTASYSGDGNYSLTVSGTGIYTGTFSSPILTIGTAISSVTQYNPLLSPPYTSADVLASITMSIPPTSYSWSYVSGPTVSFSNTTIANPRITRTGVIGTPTVVKCDMFYTGGLCSTNLSIFWL